MNKRLENIDSIIESYGVKKEIPKKVKSKEPKFGVNSYFQEVYSNCIDNAKIIEEDVASDNYKIKRLIESVDVEEDLYKISDFLEITDRFDDVIGDGELDLSTKKSVMWNLIKNEGGVGAIMRGAGKALMHRPVRLGAPLAHAPIRPAFKSVIANKINTFGRGVRRAGVIAGKTAAAGTVVTGALATGGAIAGAKDAVNPPVNSPPPPVKKPVPVKTETPKSAAPANSTPNKDNSTDDYMKRVEARMDAKIADAHRKQAQLIASGKYTKTVNGNTTTISGRLSGDDVVKSASQTLDKNND